MKYEYSTSTMDLLPKNWNKHGVIIKEILEIIHIKLLEYA